MKILFNSSYGPQKYTPIQRGEDITQYYNEKGEYVGFERRFGEKVYRKKIGDFPGIIEQTATKDYFREAAYDFQGKLYYTHKIPNNGPKVSAFRDFMTDKLVFINHDKCQKIVDTVLKYAKTEDEFFSKLMTRTKGMNSYMVDTIYEIAKTCVNLGLKNLK